MKDPHTEHAEKLLGAVNDAADAVSSRFVTFVSVGAYVAVTVASTDHEMLLRANNLVTLPLLNAQIPIVGVFGFYTIAPWLILLLHSDLLLQLSILSTELERFEAELAKAPESERSYLRQRVANFYYVLYFTGQAPSRLLHLLAAFITWVTAVAIPLGLLIWIQVRFLPYHSPMDTWFHRAAVIADAGLIAFILLPRITPLLKVKRGAGGFWTAIRRALSVPSLVIAGCVLSVVFSLVVATIPDEEHEGGSLFPKNMQLRQRVLVSSELKPEDINALRDENDPARLDPVLDKIVPFQALQGRDFRYADLYEAVFPKIDLRAAREEDAGQTAPLPTDCHSRRGCTDPPECDHAAGRRTQLSGATFEWATMQKAMFDDAVLEDAKFVSAKLQQASFGNAQANGARFSWAKLDGARFNDAKLCGADFSSAIMPGGSLERAFLQGATLRGAKLSGAHLNGADLRGADLSYADLSDAKLQGALLQGAAFSGASTGGASFESAAGERIDLSANASPPSPEELAASNSYLVELACAQVTVARGIARQALHKSTGDDPPPARDGRSLARAILDAEKTSECGGVKSLPPELKAELLALASPGAP